jgi:CRP/FNR family cyclic AMP-dependent transcriptional regulator
MRAQLGQATYGRQVTASALRRIPLFREVPEGALASLAAVSVRQVLRHGDILWQPDDAIEAVFVLVTGSVRLYRTADNGQEITVALLDRGQVCGLTDLDAAFLPTTVAQSLTEETVVYRIPRRDFAAFLRANPAVALRALDAIGHRVRDAYELLALSAARARVAYVLAHLATANGERMVWLTHEELASLVGVGREAITRYVLPDLRGRGLIAYEGHRRGIHVVDSAQLVALPRHSM